MTPILQPLAQANETQQFGGKGSGLAWLIAQDCTVPDGCVLPVSAFAQGKKADKKAVMQIVEQYQNGLNSNSLDDVMAIFAPDAVVMAANAPASVGTDAVRERYAAMTNPESTMDISLEIKEMNISGDVAYLWTHNTGTYKGAEGAGGTIDSKSLMICRKGKDGWKVHRYMFNNNLADN